MRKKLLQRIMQEYDNNCHPKARRIAERLFRQGLDELSDKELYKLATDWFPGEFRVRR